MISCPYAGFRFRADKRAATLALFGDLRFRRLPGVARIFRHGPVAARGRRRFVDEVLLFHPGAISIAMKYLSADATFMSFTHVPPIALLKYTPHSPGV